MEQESIMSEPRDPSDKHFRISMVKSVLRIVACILLPFTIVGGAIGLGLAEILGIYEEL